MLMWIILMAATSWSVSWSLSEQYMTIVAELLFCYTCMVMPVCLWQLLRCGQITCEMEALNTWVGVAHAHFPYIPVIHMLTLSHTRTLLHAHIYILKMHTHPNTNHTRTLTHSWLQARARTHNITTLTINMHVACSMHIIMYVYVTVQARLGMSAPVPTIFWYKCAHTNKFFGTGALIPKSAGICQRRAHTVTST